VTDPHQSHKVLPGKAHKPTVAARIGRPRFAADAMASNARTTARTIFNNTSQ